MNKENTNKEILEAFQIPEDSIYLDDKLDLSSRELTIKSLKQIIKDKNLNIPLGPKLDLDNPERSILLNKFDIQVISTSLISEEITVPLKNIRIKNKGPQIFLAVQVEEELNIVYFKGILTSEEFQEIVKSKKIKGDEVNISINCFTGGINRLLRFVRLLDPIAIKRAYIPKQSYLISWNELQNKLRISSSIIIGAVLVSLFGPQLFRPRLIGGIATLTPEKYEVISYTRSFTSQKNEVCLLTPLANKNSNNELEAIVNIDEPVIYALKPLNEINIYKNGKIVWSKSATSKEKINGYLNWPLTPIKKADNYKLSLRPESAGFGSNVEINLKIDQNKTFLKKEEIENMLGKSQRAWINFINKNLLENRNTSLSLLLSKNSPKSKTLEKAKLEIIKNVKCD